MRSIELELLERGNSIELRHHDVEQHQIRLDFTRPRQRLLPVGRRDDFVAVGLESHAYDFQILWHVVDGEDAGRRSQDFARYCGRNSCTIARILRGLNGLATYPSHPASSALDSSPDRA